MFYVSVYRHDGRADYFRYSHESRADYVSYSHDGRADYIRYSRCLLYTSDAADDMQCVDLGGRRIIKNYLHDGRANCWSY